MKWIYAALFGWITGSIVFAMVWAVLASYAKREADQQTPRWPVIWAASIAFMVIALSWAGFFREVLPLPGPDDYQDRP